MLIHTSVLKLVLLAFCSYLFLVWIAIDATNPMINPRKSCIDFDPLHNSDHPSEEGNIISNSNFSDGLNHWSGRGCKIVLHETMADGGIVPHSGNFFASTTQRTHSWNGIQQDITGKLHRKLVYEVDAAVRVFSNNVNTTTAEIQATLYWINQSDDQHENYMEIARVQATNKDWVQMKGKFAINGFASRVIIFLQGPPPGNDILLSSFVLKHAAKETPSPRPIIKDPGYGVNIITNSHLNKGSLYGWFPFGNCSLSVGTGSPLVLPPIANASLGAHHRQPLSGRYIIAKNRKEKTTGPAQMITDKVKLYLTYQVSAWVRIGHAGSGNSSTPQTVNLVLSADDQLVNGGQVELVDDGWHEIAGSFRIENEQPAAKVMAWILGPDPGVDLMVTGVQIFPVDRQARFKFLRKRTDKIRKRDVVLRLSAPDSGSSLLGTLIRVKQTQNSFPFGSCLLRTIIDNEVLTNFFLKNFNWAVFGNELKWFWTEPEQGKFHYKDADELLNFCASHNIQVRGHCIFWEVESNVQDWVRNLNKSELMVAVQNRLTGLLARYQGKFAHYDVDNEMLHGSFYQDRLGQDARAYMFRTAHQLDPSATLFVNDYHIEDGSESKASPEKYINQIVDLREQGAPVGGIGIQGHISNPVGTIVHSALNKMATVGLPIWFTELDVVSNNEYIRADDLEVMLREVFAHPAVEGIILFGFWELNMFRENSHLVNAEGDINEAGRRYLALKNEWLTRAHGHIDGHGQFSFRGFHGSYELEITRLIVFPHAANTLLSLYSKSQDLRSVKLVFNEIDNPDVYSHDNCSLTSVLSLCSPELLDFGLQLHSLIIKTGLLARASVLNSLLTMYFTCQRVDDAFGVFEEGGAFQFDQVEVSNALLSAYSRHGCIDQAFQIFSYMNSRNLISWNTVISGYQWNALPTEGLRLFSQLVASGIIPNTSTLCIALNICAGTSALRPGKQVHNYICKTGFFHETSLNNSLITVCQVWQSGLASKIFQKMMGKDTITWNPMISAYKQHGREAVRCFEMMQHCEVRPDVATFMAVLSACSHSGLVSDGCRIFNSMVATYGIEPDVDHFSCIIDLLGRAGFLDETETLISGKHIEIDSNMWWALFSSCAAHGNLRLGRIVVGILLETEQHDLSVYVLLSNVYAGDGKSPQMYKNW
ncbi:OLC1v1016587C1 [Oldenlandia corymbosa var. corymbosa]|uniref:OLC1v1016587C1 n=1 Tax=Oldenlandia corymbosa var. corymbosa TaxID=529605 RepID=A0AAV1E762_OLDCO|nr:OLC1v1016587C1 [Oldenlandia corymbosa var. corymbosa]